MMDLSKPLNASQAHSYHEREFASAEQRYYSQGDTVGGEWFGRLAAEWGLTGAVRDEQFHRLAEGQHPATGEQPCAIAWPPSTKTSMAKGFLPPSTVRVGMRRSKLQRASQSRLLSVRTTGFARLTARVSALRLASWNGISRPASAAITRLKPLAAEITGKMIAATFEHDSARPETLAKLNRSKPQEAAATAQAYRAASGSQLRIFDSAAGDAGR